MVRKLVTASTALAFAIGMVAVVGSGAASANGGPPTPGTATGKTICNFHGTLAVSDTGTVSIRGTLTPRHVPACSNKGGTKLKTGHLFGLASTASTTGICNLLTGGSLPDVSGGTIRWSPKHSSAASTGIALTGGTISTLVGTDSPLQVAYTGGSVAAGSFTNGSGASLKATTQQTTAELTVECALAPVDSIAINGSLTL